MTTILLIAHGSRDPEHVAEFERFAAELERYLEAAVVPCYLELADPPIVEGLTHAIEGGADHIVALPLFLGPAGHQKNDVPTLLNWARQAWPHVTIDYGTPLGIHPRIVELLDVRAQQALTACETTVPPDETAVLVVGRGSRDPDSNSNVFKLSRLLWEGRDYGWVETAFYSLTTPVVPEGIARCVRLGARRVVVVPHFLFTGVLLKRIEQTVADLQDEYRETELLMGTHLGIDERLFAVIRQRIYEATTGEAAINCDACKYRHRFAGFEDEYGLPQTSDHSHGMRGVSHSHGLPASDILPPRYRNGDEVRSAPMGAAALKFDEAGNVAWDRIWTDFCDLALAGGPPHRGDLLEPAPPEAVRADPDGYAETLDELARGIRMVTGLPVVRHAAAGWIGVRCESEEMAIWLLRAILVENVSVRREREVLYLPAGPDYRLKYEIKNVVTAVAKTYHYWTEHMMRDA